MSKAKRRVLVNHQYMEEYLEDDARPLLYRKMWRFLHLYLSNYEFICSFHSLHRGIMSIDEAEPSFKELAETSDSSMGDVELVSDGGGGQFHWAHLRDVKVQVRRRSLRLLGWAQLENSSIDVFSFVKDSMSETKPYSATFRRVMVNIHEADQDKVGSLLLWDERMRQHDDENPGEDYLIAEMHVQHGFLDQLRQEIRERGEQTSVDIFVEAHLFQNEIESSFSEPFEHQYLMMIYDMPCSIFVNTISVGSRARLVWGNGTSTAT